MRRRTVIITLAFVLTFGALARMSDAQTAQTYRETTGSTRGSFEITTEKNERGYSVTAGNSTLAMDASHDTLWWEYQDCLKNTSVCAEREGDLVVLADTVNGIF